MFRYFYSLRMESYPEDYVVLRQVQENGERGLTWSIDLYASSNGQYRCFKALPSGISIRVKELWDGAEMSDETQNFSYDQYKQGMLDDWISEKLGNRYLFEINENLRQNFPEHFSATETAAESPSRPAANRQQKSRRRWRFDWKVLLLLAFACWVTGFPLMRMINTVRDHYFLEMRSTKALVAGSGISSRKIYYKNASPSTSHTPFVRVKFFDGKDSVETKVSPLAYDSVTGDDAKQRYWLNTYVPGDSVKLFYLEGHADQCGLDPENIRPALGWLLLDSVLFLFGIACFVVAFKIMRRKI